MFPLLHHYGQSISWHSRSSVPGIGRPLLIAVYFFWWSSSLSFGFTFSPRVRIPVGSGTRPIFPLRNIAWCSKSWSKDGRISTKNSPRGRPHWSGIFKFEGHQGRLFPEAPPGEGQAQAVDQVRSSGRKSTDFPQESLQDSRCGNPTHR